MRADGIMLYMDAGDVLPLTSPGKISGESKQAPFGNTRGGKRDLRKRKKDRRRSVREGIFVSISGNGEKRRVRDRRRR